MNAARQDPLNAGQPEWRLRRSARELDLAQRQGVDWAALPDDSAMTNFLIREQGV
jgi:hypothetical protein